MEKAIKKAIEGGYKLPWISARHISTIVRYKDNYSVLFLDPLFWQALGKAEGWSTYAVCQLHGNECLLKCDRAFAFEWIYQWHKFIDHLAEGKDINSFFNELL